MDQYADMKFPLGGVNVQAEFEQQLPLTTAVGVNARAREPLTRRLRGASRAGLVRAVPEQLPLAFSSGSRVIQHLNVIVDPTSAALLDAVEEDRYGDPAGLFFASGEADPSTSNLSNRNPGRHVRKGGSGIQHHRQAAFPSTGTATVTFFAQGDGTYSISIEVVDGTDAGVYGNDDIPFEGSSSFPALDSLPPGLVGTHPASYSHTGSLLTGFSL